MGTVEAGQVLAASLDHVVHCFDTLLNHYEGSGPPTPSFENAHCPLFVTWNKVARSGDPRLRGCIGTLEPRELHKALGDYALTSALRDRRFHPISQSEVPSLHCTVSLLTQFEPAGDWRDWTIGKHGLIIEFRCPRTGVALSATYLPEVAHQQGWDHQESIDSLIQKAGYGGPVGEELREALQITRYQSSLHTMTYEDFVAWKSKG